MAETKLNFEKEIYFKELLKVQECNKSAKKEVIFNTDPSMQIQILLVVEISWKLKELFKDIQKYHSGILQMSKWRKVAGKLSSITNKISSSKVNFEVHPLTKFYSLPSMKVILSVVDVRAYINENLLNR